MRREKAHQARKRRLKADEAKKAYVTVERGRPSSEMT